MIVSRKALSGVLLVAASFAVAQTPPAPPMPATRPAPAMNVDPLEAAKTQLKASDEEWQLISAALRKVVAARRNADAGLVSGNPMQRGGFGGGGRGGRMGGPGGGGPGMGNDAFGGPANNMGGRGGDRGGRPGGPPDGMPPGGDPNGPPGMGGPPGQGGPGMGGPPGTGGGPVAAALNELKAATADAKTPADEVKAKIDAVRAERKKARATLAAAVDDLKSLVTPEQEAVLIGLGYIE